MLSTAKHLLVPEKKADSSAPPQNDMQSQWQAIQPISKECTSREGSEIEVIETFVYFVPFVVL